MDGPCGQIPVTVPRNCRFLVIVQVYPDFVGTSRLSIEGATKPFEFPNQFSVGHTATEILPSPVGERTIPAGSVFPLSL